MPHNPSAKKSVRQTEKNRLRNKIERTRLRTQVKKFLSAVEAGDKKKAASEYVTVTSFLDKAAKHNLVHDNYASRRKSRLAVKLNALGEKK